MSPIGVATSHSTQAKQTSTAKLWLLMVGVNEYQDEQLPALNYSAFDCQGLAEALANATGQFPHKEVKIFHDFAPQHPSLENVRYSLQQITTTAKPQDTILFYFSGHGIVEANTRQAILCLADTQKSNLLNTGLKLQELLQSLANCAAQNQLVWLDACHSGGMTLRKTIITEPLLNPTPQLVEVLQQRAAKSKGFYALLSCDNNQQSWEFPELRHGVFTYYLIQGLQGEAADFHGVISADRLYRYVYYQTLQYIDKTNQQLRLINQQKRGKGDNQLFSEYPLQTPKRIVEGVGEQILGVRQEKSTQGLHRRLGLVVEGLSGSKITLDISKFLGTAGSFELEYLQATTRVTADDVKKAIARHFDTPAQQPETTLLYLRFRIEETEAGEWLVLGENIRIKRSWLKQQLRRCNAKQIIILDCPVETRYIASLQDWVEELQLDSQQGQCIIACASPPEESERFAQTLLDVLMVGSLPSGLSAAGAIAQLQISLAGIDIPFHVWLSGAQGIIEIIPANTDSQRREQRTGLDLGICPYMGLSAFAEEDAQYFYGRETLTQQLIHQLTNTSFLAVVGASGSGKSSIVQAGVIPQLRLGKQIPNSEQWWFKSLRPGANPLEELARVLGESGKGVPSPHLLIEGILHQGVEGFVYWLRSLPHSVVVLVVDQFEELFTLAPNPDREKFLELLFGAVKYASDRFKLIITLRADFIAPCLEVPALAEALQESSVLVPPRLSLDDYRRVILNPAQQVGLKIEPELVEVLLRELNDSAGDLPLLEFVLEQLWQHRTAGKLTLQAYQQQLGGIQGALERSSQAVYDSLDSQEQECAKWIFLSLTQLGEGTEDTRRRIHKSELVVKKYPAALVEKTLAALTAAKLVVMNVEEDEAIGGSRGDKETGATGVGATGVGGIIKENSPPPPPSPKSPPPPLPPSSSAVTIEVAHEILIRHWSTLRWWLEENRDRLRKQRQIEQAAQLWLQSSQQSDFLLQGVRLAEAEDIYIKYTDELSADVQRFIEACLAERKRLQQQEKSRLRQAQRAVVALSFLGVAACSFGGLAYWNSQTAQLREIEALNSSAKANFLSNLQLEALIASVQAGKQLKHTIGAPADVQFQTVSRLGDILSKTQELNRLEGHNAPVLSASFSPDGKIIASGSEDATVKLWNRDGKLLRTLPRHNNSVWSVSFSPDGSMLASASFDKTVKLWRTRDGALIRTFKNHNREVLSVAWSADGKFIASSDADRKVKIWNVRNGRLLKTFSGHNDFVYSVSFSPDSQTLASASADKTIKIWKIPDGQLLKTLQKHTGKVFSVAFSPDGKLLASASADKTIKIWKSSDGSLIKSIPAHTAEVQSVSFSPDSQTLASGSIDNTIKLWNTQDGTLLETFTGHSNGVRNVNFSPDSQTIISASADKTVRLWQRDEILPRTLSGHQARVNSVNFNSDGNLLATASDDTTIKLWGIPDGSLRQTINVNQNALYSANFSPDGKILASTHDYEIKLWQTSNGKLIKTLPGHDGEVNSVSFSPSGDILASASADTTIKLWRMNNQTLINTLKRHNDEVLSVAFSPQGNIIASAGRDKTIKIWRTSDGKLLQNLTGHTNSINSVTFNPQGDIIASASSDKSIKLWRVSDGQLLHTLEGHSDAIWWVSFSPDGKIIASASQDKTVKLWSLDGKTLKTLRGYSDSVMSVAFHPNHNTPSKRGKNKEKYLILASASKDGSVKLWQLDNTELQTLNLNNLLVRSCSWLHDYLKTNPNLKDQNQRSLCSDSEESHSQQVQQY